jgi:glutathione peroxidase
MKKFVYRLLIGMGMILPFGPAIAQRPESAVSRKSIFDYSYTSIEGKEVDLAAFKGRYILFVNVASKCGYTPQYAELEKLFLDYKDKLVIIGFPANDFGSQEPGTNEEIARFCSTTYDVTFPMARKTMVIGDGMHPIYKWLTDPSLNGWNDKAPKWNFTKYLVGKDGELLKVFPSKTVPLSEEITSLMK